MRSVGVSDADFGDPDDRLPLRTYWELWQTVVRRIPDPDLGVRFGSSVDTRETGLLGYVTLHSRTLERALARLVRFSKLWSEGLEGELVNRGESWEVVLHGSQTFYPLRQVIDDEMAALLSLAREVTGAEIVPIEATFTYPRPADLTQLREFYRCPLAFGAPLSKLVFRDTDLKRESVAGDATLAKYLEENAERVLRSLQPGGSLADTVRRRIWPVLAEGKPTIDTVAAAMGMTARTLQRRLREEGTSYAAILEAFRKGMAGALLSDPDLAVYEVAYLLGYSEPSSFYRAFRRWTQLSPYEYRKQRLSA